MPFIEIKTSVSLSDGQKEQLKAGLGRAITTIPGKTEEVTMVGLVSDYNLYFAGQKLARGAYVEVKLFGEASFEAKEALNYAICELLMDIIAVQPASVYLTYDEKQVWGARGQLNSK